LRHDLIQDSELNCSVLILILLLILIVQEMGL
jgi:hypothetical protein